MSDGPMGETVPAREPDVRVIRAVIETSIYLGPARYYDGTDLEAQVRSDMDADPAAFVLDQLADFVFVSLRDATEQYGGEAKP